jgi:hypothetical protein
MAVLAVAAPVQSLSLLKDCLIRRVVFAMKAAQQATLMVGHLPFSGKSCYSLFLPITSTV